MQKDHMRMLKIMWSLLRIWWIKETQNNLACTESVRIFRKFNLDTMEEEKAMERQG